MKNYEIIEHTADIGIRVWADDLAGLFRNAGLAIFELSCERTSPDKEKHKTVVTQQAEGIEELFVNWLNELLSLSAVKGLVFEDIVIREIRGNSVKAVAIGSSISNFKVNSEIKAATYHQLKIEKTHSGWQAEVIFDV